MYLTSRTCNRSSRSWQRLWKRPLGLPCTGCTLDKTAPSSRRPHPLSFAPNNHEHQNVCIFDNEMLFGCCQVMKEKGGHLSSAACAKPGCLQQGPAHGSMADCIQGHPAVCQPDALHSACSHVSPQCEALESLLVQQMAHKFCKVFCRECLGSTLQLRVLHTA